MNDLKITHIEVAGNVCVNEGEERVKKDLAAIFGCFDALTKGVDTDDLIEEILSWSCATWEEKPPLEEKIRNRLLQSSTKSHAEVKFEYCGWLFVQTPKTAVVDEPALIKVQKERDSDEFRYKVHFGKLGSQFVAGEILAALGRAGFSSICCYINRKNIPRKEVVEFFRRKFERYLEKSKKFRSWGMKEEMIRRLVCRARSAKKFFDTADTAE